MLVYLVKGKPFILFTDFKSNQILETEVKKSSQFTPKLHQFLYVQRVAKLFEKWNKLKSEQLSPVSQAFADGNYAFLYVTTHPSVKQVDYRKVYVTNKKEMMKFMSFLSPLYVWPSSTVALAS